ncbi:MAG TPA: energy transducer TonB [Rhizobium sp.]
MSDWTDSLRPRWRLGEIALWAGAGLVMLAVHVATVAWALYEPPVAMASDSPPPAIMIELAPTPEAVNTEETNVAPDKTVSEEVKSETLEPVEDPKPELAPEPTKPLEEQPTKTTEVTPETPIEKMNPIEEVDPIQEQVEAALENVEVPLPVARPKPPERVVEKEKPKKIEKVQPKRQAQASKQTDKAQAQVDTSNRNAAQASATGSGSSMSPATWQSRLISHLERRKRYPASARARGETGIAYVRFQIDDAGNVISATLARSSGFPDLDAEVVDLVKRASPVPAPPAGVNKTITAPLRFSVRQ